MDQNQLLARLYAELRPIHQSSPKGASFCEPVSQQVASALKSRLRNGYLTAETGTGFSTLLFAAYAHAHLCVTLDEPTIENTKTLAEDMGVSLDKVQFFPGKSEEVLPLMELAELDVVLVDGGVSFPTPIIDWWSFAKGLKRGGWMFVNNCYFPAARLVCDFMLEDAGWSLVDSYAKKVPGRQYEEAMLFRKKDGQVRPWASQQWSVKNLHIPRSFLR